ncbi:MAG: response regulator [Nitrospirae bacterium]|nr:MAG: response regulator [Nitrospirota bacterium]
MSKKTILIIDDSPEVRRQCSSLLKEAGFEVITAEDGDQGFELLKQIRPDIIFVDFIMPRVNGFRFCKLLLNDPGLKNIPVVVLTEKKEDVIRTFKEKLGISHYLKKPFHPTELLSKINEIIFKVKKEKDEPLSKGQSLSELKLLIGELLRKDLRGLIKTTLYEVLKETDTLQTGNVLISGRIGRLTPSDIIQFVSMSKLSGKLSFIAMGLNSEFYFSEGDILYCSFNTDERSSSFIDFLKRENKLTDANLRELLSDSEQNELPLEICAVNRGIATWEDTKRAIRETVEEGLFHTLSVKTGHYYMEDIEIPDTIKKIGFRAQAEAILLDTLRRIDESMKDSIAR